MPLIGLELVACSGCRCPVQDRTAAEEANHWQTWKSTRQPESPIERELRPCKHAYLDRISLPGRQTATFLGDWLTVYYVLGISSPNRAVPLQFRQSGLRNCGQGVMQLKPQWEHPALRKYA